MKESMKELHDKIMEMFPEAEYINVEVNSATIEITPHFKANTYSPNINDIGKLL